MLGYLMIRLVYPYIEMASKYQIEFSGYNNNTNNNTNNNNNNEKRKQRNKKIP